MRRTLVRSDGRLFSRRMFVGGVASSAVAACAARTLAAYSYRLAVVVSVGGQDVIGHSIVRVRWEDARGEFMNHGSNRRAFSRGEAASVYLGEEHGYLFALLRGPDSRSNAYFSCVNSPVGALTRRPVEWWHLTPSITDIQAMADRRGKAELTGKLCPLLVRFRDRALPSSVEEVYPQAFEAAYGKDVQLKSISVEVVNIEPTETLATVLPWIREYRRTLADESAAAGELASDLGSVQFRTWEDRAV